MSDRLTEIREMIERIERVVVEFEAEWPDLDKDTPAKLYLRDVGYLLGFLTEHPGSEPPGNDRMVLVKLPKGIRRMGCFRRGQWFVFGHQGGLAPGYSVESWQELPPVRNNEP